MSTLNEIIAKYEKAYIIFKDSECKRRFVSESLREGIVFTNGSLPELSNKDDIIVIYKNKTIARLGWAGRIKYRYNRDNAKVVLY